MGNRCLLGNFLPGSNLASPTPHIVAECVQLSVRNDVTQKLSQNEWMIKLRGIKEFKATPGGDFTLPGEMSMRNPQYQKIDLTPRPSRCDLYVRLKSEPLSAMVGISKRMDQNRSLIFCHSQHPATGFPCSQFLL